MFETIKKVDHIWLLIWCFIFFSFITLDLFFQICYNNKTVFYDFLFFGKIIHLPVIQSGTFIGVTILKYIGVVLNLVYARIKFPKDYLLQIALLFTLLADTILTINSVDTVGVLVFCFAQYFHLSRFASMRPSLFLVWNFFIVLFLIFGQINGIKDIYILAGIYLFSIISNFILSYRWTHHASSLREVIASHCALFGFFLFISCDFHVAISYLSVINVLPAFLVTPANFLAWFFYYPSQVLIANSSVLSKSSTTSQKSLVL